jgi:hypothetical protein
VHLPVLDHPRLPREPVLRHRRADEAFFGNAARVGHADEVLEDGPDGPPDIDYLVSVGEGGKGGAEVDFVVEPQFGTTVNLLGEG